MVLSKMVRAGISVVDVEPARSGGALVASVVSLFRAFSLLLLLLLLLRLFFVFFFFSPQLCLESLSLAFS